MTATRDLIAAVLTLADEVDDLYENAPVEQNSNEIRELCARAMVQPAAPDMGEVERLLEAYDHEYASGGSVEDYDRARAALLDCVRQFAAGPHPVSTHKIIAPTDPDYAESEAYLRQQPVSTAEVTMPEPYTYIGCGWDARPVYSTAKLEAYGDAREAAGYARGLAEADKLAHTLAMARSTFKKYADLHSAKGTDDGREKAAANMRLVNLCDAALRGEVKP